MPSNVRWTVDGRAGVTGMIFLAVVCLTQATAVRVITREKKALKRSYKLFHLLSEFCNLCFVQRG